MPPELADALLRVTGLYAAIGVLAGVPFVIWGIGRVDHAAKGAPWAFRVLVLPGVIAMWPLMVRRWWASRGAP